MGDNVVVREHDGVCLRDCSDRAVYEGINSGRSVEPCPRGPCECVSLQNVREIRPTAFTFMIMASFSEFITLNWL